MRNGNATVLLPVSEVNDLVEEEGPAGGTGEPRGDELVPVGQEGVALRAREEPLPTDVLQIDATHLESAGGRRGQRGSSGPFYCNKLGFFGTSQKVRPFCVVFH